MGNGDSEQLTFTRRDSERLIRIEEKLDDVMEVQTQVTRNTTWIKVMRWAVGGGGLVLVLRIFNIV